MAYGLEFKRISLHSEKKKRECIKTSVNWKPSSSITTDETVFRSHQSLMASKCSSITRYWHWQWVDLWWFGMRDMCGCHSHGNKDKCGSSPTMTSCEQLVMHNPSHSTTYTTTCTPTWLHCGWETQWPHCVWLHTVLSFASRDIRNNIVLVPPWLVTIVRLSPPHFGDCVDSTLPTGSLAEALKRVWKEEMFVFGTFHKGSHPIWWCHILRFLSLSWLGCHTRAA